MERAKALLAVRSVPHGMYKQYICGCRLPTTDLRYPIRVSSVSPPCFVIVRAAAVLFQLTWTTSVALIVVTTAVVFSGA